MISEPWFCGHTFPVLSIKADVSNQVQPFHPECQLAKRIKVVADVGGGLLLAACSSGLWEAADHVTPAHNHLPVSL